MSIDIENPGIFTDRLKTAIKAIIVPLLKSDTSGLSNVDNTSDSDKPISTATAVAISTINTNIAQKANKIYVDQQLDLVNDAIFDKADSAEVAIALSNKASVDSLDNLLAKSQNLNDLSDKITARSNLGLGTAATTESSAYATATQGTKADTALQPSQKGQPNGVAPLDNGGKIDSAFLPTDGSFTGTWNASTNIPAIASGEGINNQFYIVDIPGNTEIDGGQQAVVAECDKRRAV